MRTARFSRVATATAAELFGLTCRVYMGSEDVRRQELNVFRMRAMGAEVFPVESGSRTLKDATNEAMREWMSSVEHTHYIIGSVVGPHPFPMMVRDFQSCIGEETKEQCLNQVGKLPEVVVAWSAAGRTRPACSTRSWKTRWNWSAWKPAVVVACTETTRPR